LKRVVSTVSDEIKINAVSGKYDAEKAQAKSRIRRRNAKYRGMKVTQDLATWNQIDAWLLGDQSPELIAGRIKDQEKDLLRVSSRSIRRYIRSVYGRRIEAHRKRKRRRKGGRGRINLKDRKTISQRPISSENRTRVGHAEGDFVCSGKSGKGVVLHVVDRKLKIHFLERIINTCLGNITKAIGRIKKRYPELKTLTTDNDLLFQHHRRLEKLFGIKIFFCDPGKAWQKGQVEEANKELRKYITKGSDISRWSRYKIKKVENKLNSRFMKCLHHLSPKEALERYRKQKNSHEAVKNGCSD